MTARRAFRTDRQGNHSRRLRSAPPPRYGIGGRRSASAGGRGRVSRACFMSRLCLGDWEVSRAWPSPSGPSAAESYARGPWVWLYGFNDRCSVERRPARPVRGPDHVTLLAFLPDQDGMRRLLKRTVLGGWTGRRRRQRGEEQGYDVTGLSFVRKACRDSCIQGPG